MDRSAYTEEVQKKHEAALLDAGNKLANPPSSIDELLSLLTRAEVLLHYVYQTPHQSIEAAIRPAMQALIADAIFKHSDLNIQVAVASCFNEMVRIAAPDYPYTDDQMKEIFRLFMVAFKQLSCESGKNYVRAREILETVAAIRSCLIMQDIEIDSMVVEMFQIFLDTIRTNHSADVFNHMKTIMIVMIQESDEISEDLLRPLLSSVKMDNKNTSPRSWELGKSAIENCATRLQHHVREAVKAMNLNVADYTEIVASLCQDTPIGNDTVANDEVEEVASLRVANEEVEIVWVANEVTTAQFGATDASGDGVSKLDERSQAGPETQIQAERRRRGIKHNTLMRPEEGYKHARLAGVSGSSRAYCYSDNKEEKDSVLPSELKTAKMPSDSSEKEIDSVQKVSIGKRASMKQEGMTMHDKAQKKTTKGVLVDIEKEQVNQSTTDSDRKDENEITSLKHGSGDVVDKGVESPMSKPANAKHSKVKEKRSNIRKKTTKRVVGSITTGAKKKQVNHSASDSELKDEKEITSQKHESANAVEKVVEFPLSKSTKQSKVEERGSNKGKKAKGDVRPRTVGAGKAKVSHRVAGPEGKDENEITTQKHESGDVDKLVESPVCEPAKDKQSEVKQKGSNKWKKTTKSVVQSSNIVEEKEKASHSVADSVEKDENEIAPRKHESADVEKVVESPTPKPTKAKQSKLKEKGSSKRKKITKSVVLRSYTLGAEKEKVSHGDRDPERKDENKITSQNHEIYESADVVDKVVESPKPAKPKYPGGLDSEKEMEPMDFRLEYGRELVNLRMMVWWPLDQTYYTGTIESFDPVTKMHKIKYDDDEEEILDMSEERWELFNEIQSRQAQSSCQREADPSPVKEPGKTVKKTTKRKAGSLEKEHVGSSSKRSKVEGPSAVKSGHSATESIPVTDKTDDETHEANFSWKAKAMSCAGREGQKTSRRKGKPSLGTPNGAKSG